MVILLRDTRQSKLDSWNTVNTNEFLIPKAYAQSLLTFDIITHCDESFYDASPSTWQSRSWLVIVQADAVMVDAIDITLDIVSQECDTDGSVFSSTTNCLNLRDELKAHWINDNESRNGVQLITAKSLAGGAWGCAYIEGISNPNAWAYTVVTAGHNQHAQSILGAHELGHNMYGVHDDADVW